MTTAREIDPFLKADLPTRAPKRHGQSFPRRAPGLPPYDTGARPHMSYRLTRSTKKANHRTRSVQLPRSYVPLHFRATSGQEGEPPHKEHATALRLNAPSSSPKPAVEKANRHARSVQPPAVVRPLSFATTGGPSWGPRPTCHTTGVPVSGCRKIAPPLAPISRLLGAVTKD
jgi:hypothetical protein